MSEKLPSNIDRHGTGWRVRMSWPGLEDRYSETGLPTIDDAIERRAVLRRRRKAGLPPVEPTAELTLRQAAEALLEKKRTQVSRKTKRPLRASGIEWWKRATRPWREGEFADVPIPLLSRVRLEEAITTRALAHPKTARDEHAGLNAILRLAQSRGVTVEPSLLTIERLALTPRKRQALTVDQLELLAASAPDYGRRLILFLGTTGMRIGEAFSLTEDRCYLEAGSIFIGEEMTKEGADKWVELTREEVVLLREQLGGMRLADSSPTAALPSRAQGQPLVFTRKTGKPWVHFQFLRLVWYPARKRAAASFRGQMGLAADAPTPFDGLTPHDLRATAATLMRDQGWPLEVAAARLGHADSGELLARLYDQGDRRARTRRAIDALTPGGLRAATTATAEVVAEGSR